MGIQVEWGRGVWIRRAAASLAGLAGLLCASAAWADRLPHVDDIQILPSLPLADHLSITPNVGTDVTVGGAFYKGEPGGVSGAGSLFGAAISGPTTLSSHTSSFDQVFTQPAQLGINLNYGLSNRDEASLGFTWFHASGKQFDMFTSSSAVTWGNQPIAAGSVIRGQFSHDDEFGLEAGYRHFFDVGDWAGFHPYIGAMLGMKRVENIELTLRTQSGDPIATDIHFYNAGLIGDAGMTFGLRYDIGQLLALGIESGFRYEGPLNPNKTYFNGTEFQGMNSAGDRWEIPALLTLTAKFDTIGKLLK